MMTKYRAGTPFNSIKGRRQRTRHGLFVLLLGITAIAVADRAVAQSGRAEASPVEFNIPAQTVPIALKEIARQARTQLFFIENGFESVRANPVYGTYSTQRALDLLLVGTGLSASYSSDSGIKVQPVRASVNATPLVMGSQLLAAAGAAASADVTGGKYTGERSYAEAQENEQGSEPEHAGGNDEILDEVIVTGSQIRGAGAAGANVITLDREYIELSGLATTHEVLQQLVQQNFGGGANEATAGAGLGTDGFGNVGFGSSVNLRGLGTDSTLMLVNGRRSATGGLDGNFVDLNSIPATAIERVEILPDGASAIYGSDAVGGVVNVILRDDYEGAETSLRYAPGTSDIDEVRLSQVFGKRWGSGSALFTYEYYDRSELKSEDRVYTANSDLTSLGGTDHSTSGSNPGNITRYTGLGGSTNVQLAIPGGQDGTSLTAADLIPGVTNLQNIREGTYVLPAQERHSASLILFQELTNTIELFADVRYSSREFEQRTGTSAVTRIDVPSSNAFFVDPNPLGGSTALRMEYSFVDDFGPLRLIGSTDTISAALGATFNLSNTWELEAYGSYGTEETFRRTDQRVNTALLALALADDNRATAFNPFGDGSNTNPATLAAIEGFSTINPESELSTLNVRADGSLFNMSGGAAKLAIGAQFRDESLANRGSSFLSTLEPLPRPDADLRRDVTSAFAEIYLPFVTKPNSRPGIRNLIASVAARYDDYSDFGDTFNPKLGVSWSPLDSLTIRSTFGTSFRAPLLSELDDAGRRIVTILAPDPASSTGRTRTIFITGNNPGLQPEEGTTWTVGFDIQPTSLSGFELGLTYFAAEIDGVIQLPANSLFRPLRETENFAAIIRRVPADADIATVSALLNEPACGGPSCAISADEVGAIVDFRLNNLFLKELSGLDLNLTYAFDTKSAGSFNATLSASYLFDFKEQAFANAPLEDRLDTTTEPTSIRLRGGLSWNNGGLSTAIFGSHVGDYTDTFSDPERPVGSWTTWTLNVGYEFSKRDSGFLGDTKVVLNVQNIFDRDPPFVDVGPFGVGFDAINADPKGRFLALQWSKEWW